MIHIEAVSAEPGGETEQPAENCDGWWTGSRLLWARTAASTCARRSPTPPLVGTLTSIGLTRFAR